MVNSVSVYCLVFTEKKVKDGSKTTIYSCCGVAAPIDAAVTKLNEHKPNVTF